MPEIPARQSRLVHRTGAFGSGDTGDNREMAGPGLVPASEESIGHTNPSIAADDQIGIALCGVGRSVIVPGTLQCPKGGRAYGDDPAASIPHGVDQGGARPRDLEGLFPR